MDLLQREGQYPIPPQAPSTLGVEFSGTIISLPDPSQIGPDPASKPEADFKIGDEVFGLAYGGAYAEYIAVSTHMLIHKPAELSWEQAAGIPEVWITAIQAMYLIGEYQRGKSILWHAGASSVSIAGIQLAKADAASQILTTASSSAKLDFCKSLGATHAFNYTTQDWATEVLAATHGQGVDIIIDYIGAPYFDGNLSAAARDARIVCLAFMGGATLPAGVDISRLLRKRLRIEGSSLRSRDEAYQRALRDMLVQHALPRFRDGTFQVPVERVFGFEQVQEAHRLMESNRTMGKLVVRVES
jgi:NADPH:quinone reductase-like Zn-dependent oxidoreductase